MPIYDYVCESCGHVMEVTHGIHAAGPTECPECGGTLSKVFAAPAIHFRGSGWAKKDRKSVSGAVKKKAGESSEAGESASGSAADEPRSGARGGESRSDTGGRESPSGASARGTATSDAQGGE